MLLIQNVPVLGASPWSHCIITFASFICCWVDVQILWFIRVQHYMITGTQYQFCVCAFLLLITTSALPHRPSQYSLCVWRLLRTSFASSSSLCNGYSSLPVPMCGCSMSGTQVWMSLFKYLGICWNVAYVKSENGGHQVDIYSFSNRVPVYIHSF